MYRLDIMWTGKYGDVDENGNPVITITPIPDKPGTYNYSYYFYTAEIGKDEINGTVTEKLNEISTFTFSVYYGSPVWDSLFPNRTSVQLWSDKYNDYIFSGRVISVTDKMDADGIIYKTVDCESELAYLCDSVCDMNEVFKRIEEKGRWLNTGDIILTILELHRLNTGGFAGNISKALTPPYSHWDEEKEEYVIESGKIPYSKIECPVAMNEDVDTTYAVLQKLVRDSWGWDIWVEHNPDAVPEDNKYPTSQDGYLVLRAGLSGSHSGDGKTIKLGENLKSLTVERTTTADGRITRIVPLGGVGADGTRLNVYDVEQYHEGWDIPDHSIAIANEQLSITYGSVDKVIIYDDLTDDGNLTEQEREAMINELYSRGKKEADALSKDITSISADAVDLFTAGYSKTRLDVGAMVSFVAEPLGLDGNANNSTFRLEEKVTDISQPWNPRLTFGKRQSTASYSAAAMNNKMSGRIYNTGKDVSSRLDSTAVKRTDVENYSKTRSVHAENTVYYVDQGDGTVKAYLGDKPIVISGGGGGTSVEYAAVLNDGNFENFIINRQLMMQIDQHNRLYYGAAPNLVVVQGQYCFFGDTWGNLSADAKAIIQANRERFGTEYEFDVIYKNGTEINAKYKVSMQISNYTVSQSNNTENVSATIIIDNGENVRTTSTALLSDKNQRFIDAFLCPTFSRLSGSKTFGTGKAATPFGYAQATDFAIGVVALFRDKDNPEIEKWTYAFQLASNIPYLISDYRTTSCLPLASEAELYFDLAVSQKSEPVTEE